MKRAYELDVYKPAEALSDNEKPVFENSDIGLGKK